MWAKNRKKPYWKNFQTKQFVKKHFQKAIPLDHDRTLLRYASDQVKIDGEFIELGVYSGCTINYIALLNPIKTIYGFDSFQGLPEDWDRTDKYFPKGFFALKDPNLLPPVFPNVKLIKGWFKDTLPLFAKEKLAGKKIAFLHFDCDLYISTKEALTNFAPYITQGTIMAFHELYNYPCYENNEFKALQEFLKEHSLKAEFIAYNQYHEQAALRIV